MGVYSSSLSNNQNINYFPYNLDSDEIDTSMIHNANEAASEIIVQTEQNWYTMMKAVGLSELNAIETDGDVIYEAANVTSFFTAIKNFFKKLFQKIAALFKTFAMRIYANSRDAQTFCDKYKDQIESLTVPKDFEYQGYDFEHIDESVPFANWDDSELDKIQKDLGTIQDDDEAKKRKQDVDNYANTDKENDVREGIRGEVLFRNKSKKITTDEWEEEVFKYFHKNQTEKDTINNVSPTHYRDEIINANKYKSVIDEDFTKFRSEYNKLMQELEKMQNELSKHTLRDTSTPGNNNTTGTKKETDPVVDIKLKLARIYADRNKFKYECASYVYNAQLNAIEEHNKQYKAVLVKLLSKSRMSTKKLDENTEFGVSHYNALNNINFI